MLHKVLKSKYFQNSSIWRPKANTPKLVFWTSSLNVLPILKTHSFYQIMQGDISIWSTPWCNSWNTIYSYLIIQLTNFIYPALVNDLWMPDQNIWNEQLIDTLFTQQMAHTIKQPQSSNHRTMICYVGNCYLVMAPEN
jgi:hypothetical protein